VKLNWVGMIKDTCLSDSELSGIHVYFRMRNSELKRTVLIFENRKDFFVFDVPKKSLKFGSLSPRTYT